MLKFRESTNTISSMKNTKMRFILMWILGLNTKAIKNSSITYQFSGGLQHGQNADQSL